MRYITLILACAFVLVGSAALAADYVVVANKETPVTVVSQKDLKNMYLGKKTTWSDGSRVTVFTRLDSDINKPFLKQVVNKTPQQYSTYWKKSLFTGTGLPPKDFASDAELKAAIAATPGAVGYIPASALDDSVKKLEIN